MRGFVADIEEQTKQNTDFRHVIYTGQHSQLVLMSVAPDGEIGLEVHPYSDQFFRVESGKGKVIIDDNEYDVVEDCAIVVPAGAKHNIINTSPTDTLQLYTIYSPPHHQDKTVRATKEEAEAEDEDFDGVTTE